ncbi:MAG: PKD domain-containing protein [Acidobacteriota bacterium]
MHARADGSPGAASLAVTTDPAGADVYLDGKLVGATPFTLSGIPIGDHRVRVAKAGYLDNGRVLVITAGRPAAVRVTLTKAAAGAATNTAAPVVGGGGLKKWLIIGAAAGGGTAAAVMLRNSNKAPSAGTVSASPASVYAGDTVQFSITGDSDPDGDPLSYTWDFGDGGTATGKTTTHAYSTAGGFTATVTVSDGKKSATASGSVTVKVNAAPSPGVVTVSSTTALAGTNVTFSSVGASDPDGDALTYSWNFGDGTTGTGQSVTKAYTNGGSFTATVTVRDGRTSVTASGAVTIRTLAATWVGGLNGIKTLVTFTQSGGNLSGTFAFDIGFPGTVSGSISASTRAVTFTVSVPGFQAFTFTGNPSGDFNTLTGVANGSGFVNTAWTMTRQ